MSKGKYVAYVSAYTSGNQSSCGIRIYDVDMNHGRFTEKDRVEITNSLFHYRLWGRGLPDPEGWYA